MDCHMFGFMSFDANAKMNISLLETFGELEVQNQDFFFSYLYFILYSLNINFHI